MSICNYDNELVLVCCLWQPAQIVHCDGLQGPACKEQSQMELTFEGSSVDCAFTAVANCRVNAICYVWPVEFTSRSVVPATIAEQSSQFWMM